MNLLEGDMHLVGIRPEHVHLDPDAALRGRVLSVESTGADRFVRAATQRGEIAMRLPAKQEAPEPGELIGIAFDERWVRRYDCSTGKLLT